MIKALFFDIDGTLVSFNTHEIPMSTIEAMERAKAKGILLFIATGRPNVIINNLSAIQERNLIDGYVTMNGAYCFVGDKTIYKCPINKSDVHALLNHCEANEKACIVVGEKEMCVCGENEEVRYIFYDALKVQKLPNITFQEGREKEMVFQMTPFITSEEEKKVVPLIPHCEVGRWYPTFADVTAIGNTKELGIQKMAEYFGLKVEETMAFGDGGNDIPMLRSAGIGVAMGNASEEVQREADYVTTSVDEDGIKNALIHFGLI